jgi:uncharacterized Tic20 family protein
MTNQNLIFVCIVLCSLGGWYVVLTKYLELKAMMKNKSNNNNIELHPEPLEPVSPDFNKLPENFEFNGQHIPGMGPPPNANIPFTIPEDLLSTMRSKLRAAAHQVGSQQNQNTQPVVTKPQPQDPAAVSKRIICNWAAVIHLSGLTMVLGIPFVNIIAPAILWLLKKEQHPFLAKQGREVVNFQITFSLIQFLFLGLGTMFIWLWPHAAESLLASTKTLRIVFSTSMHLPYNIFTVIPFYWGCIVAVRGAVAAYHGIAYKYPYAQPFIFDQPQVAMAAAPVKAAPKPQPKREPTPVAPGLTNISFS